MSHSLSSRPEELDAIIGGYHGNPFGILGPHQYEQEDQSGVLVRAFIPAARSVTIEVDTADGSETEEMDRVHPAGFFERFFADYALPMTYRFHCVGNADNEWTTEDPYRFGSYLTDFDEYLMAQGTHMRVYEKQGAHPANLDYVDGTLFAVWAPNASRVSVIGNFNQWDGRRHVMRFHANSGIWEMFIPDVGVGELYKYEIKTNYLNYTVAKSDPVGFFSEMRPNTASIVWDIDRYEWGDEAWMAGRADKQALNAPISIYEVHLGSWRRKNGWEWLTYKDLADELIPYVKEMGYTHIELLPIAEHPYDGSWGYQVTGFFAPTSRFGTPDDFMAFVDACHQEGIGVLLDWVPAHFPRDAHGLAFFDGTYLYEHADPRRGAHPDWGTLIFNYGRNEVRQFLMANALFWLDKYHIDGLRVDAVASMLYLDFSREQGQWIPNQFGGRENLEAIAFIRDFNRAVHEQYPGVLTIAEESTAWPAVTGNPDKGGLGFDLKWNMGWMHDTLQYIENDPVHRSYHHGTLTFSMFYAFSEKFLLPLSHDEVVHLKRSMLDKLPGDVWQRFANLRALYAYQYSHPGKKLLFMGGEFGQWREWTEARELDWYVLDDDARHGQLQNLVAKLNRLYQEEAALHREDYNWEGFTWLEFRDAERSVISYARHTPDRREQIAVVCNFTPVVRYDYPVPVLAEGEYVEILNTDATEWGGSGVLNPDPLTAAPTRMPDKPYYLNITLSPLAVVYLKWTPTG
jgi:1,4-alpha-glucan branching enzyme